MNGWVGAGKWSGIFLLLRSLRERFEILRSGTRLAVVPNDQLTDGGYSVAFESPNDVVGPLLGESPGSSFGFLGGVYTR